MLRYNRQNVDYPTVWDTSKFLVELYLLRTQIQRQLFVLWVGRLFYRVTLSFIFEEANLSKTTNIVKKNCGCSIKISYELPCSCILTMKIKKKNLSILLDDIYPHWKRLQECEEDVDDEFSVMEEWNDFKECLKKSP